MKIYLAPMQGVIDHHMRRLLCKLDNIDICVTEFIRVTDHTLPEKVFYRYCPELKEGPELKDCQGPKDTGKVAPVRIQLLGSKPRSLARNAAKAAKLGAPGIDLNFGCPAKTVNKNRGGACLLDETDLIQDIVQQVRDAVPSEIPVSAKIRLGYEDRDSYLQNASAIEAAGASELVVHARSKADGYRPPAYWETIAEIRRELKIPVVANGEIWSVEDFSRCKEVTGSDTFMLGRGALTRPGLGRAIKDFHQGKQVRYIPWPELCEDILDFFEQTCQFYPKKYTGNRLKQWLYYLQNYYAEARQLFEQIKKERDEKLIRNAILGSSTI